QEDPGAIPEYIIAPDADLAAIRGGPRVTFDALLPKAGIFRAWVQFQRNNEVHTFPFTFDVTPGPPDPVLPCRALSHRSSKPPLWRWDALRGCKQRSPTLSPRRPCSSTGRSCTSWTITASCATRSRGQLSLS